MRLYSIFAPPGGANEANQTTMMDNDEDTVVASENRSANDREIREICLKWVFPMLGDKKKILNSHHAILAMMIKAHPELIIIDNKGQEHTEKKTMAPTEKNRPFTFYEEKSNRSTRTFACIHRMRTQKSMSELKESWGVLEALSTHKAYVRSHAFGEKDREISHIGFIPGVHMTNTSNAVVKDHIATMLRQDNHEVPNFEVVQVRIDMGKGSKASERTRAYEIQCIQKDAPRLAKQLQSGHFRQHPVYIPYRMKKSKPEVFKNAIKRQIKTLADQWVIKIQGFTPEMVHHIQAKVMEQKVEAIVPTHNTQRGEWKILVNRQDHRGVLTQLKIAWAEMIEAIPERVRNDSPHDDPKIATRNQATYESSSEEGTVDTYGTILSSLYFGTEADEDTKSEMSESESPPYETPPARPVNYAQVLRGVNSSVSQVSGWTEQRQDELTQLQDKHSDLEQKFNTVTAELGELKRMMELLLTQSSKSHEPEPPTKKQAMFDTPKRSEKRSHRQENILAIEQEPAILGSDAGQDQLQRNESY